MRRLILQTGISIDGYVAALDRSHPWDDGGGSEAVKRWILDSVSAAGAHLMGRVTYEEMAAAWPTSTSEFARPMNEIPKVVFSKTLEHADWAETRIASGDLAEEIGRLKREPGNDLIAYGGARFDHALSRLGLVDEYRLMVQPAALGAGLPLCKDLPAPLQLELVEATTYPTGLAIHVYRPRSPPGRRVNRMREPVFTETVAAQAERGNKLVLSGEFSGVRVAYLPTGRELGGSRRPSATRPPPTRSPRRHRLLTR